MKIIFFGTPEFAVPCLKALIGNGHEIAAVVTQTDKPKGRSGKPVFQPVKEAAFSCGLDSVVLQPERVKSKASVAELKKYDADIFVVAAYGQLLSEKILNMPKFGCINVHASLLPKYRGASPIQQAIINGDKHTGVTVMQMDKGLDTGDMLYKKEIEILETDTFQTLHDKLSVLGAEALIEALPQIENGSVKREKQNGSNVVYAPLLTKEMGQIDWKKTPDEIINLIRGLDPWPGAYTMYENNTLKIWKAKKTDISLPSGVCEGTVIKACKKSGLYVAANGGAVLITQIQASGGKRVLAADYLKGRRIDEGIILE